MMTIIEQCKLAHQCYLAFGALEIPTKNNAILAMADAIMAQQSAIISANQTDLSNGRKAGLTDALLDRLMLNEARLIGICDSLKTIAQLADPIGKIIDEFRPENGLLIQKKRVPLGVIGIIYEARPNVTADAIALCIKTGNCVVLRGSSSAYQSNRAITDIMTQAAQRVGVPSDGIQLLEDTTREGVKTFVGLNDYLNLIIPRGSAGLIQSVVQHSTVPTIETGVGNCHVYVDRSADLEMAKKIVINSKTQRPSVCNSCESLVLDRQLPADFITGLIQDLADQGVKLFGCKETCQIASIVDTASDDDWGTEYLDLRLSIKMVDSVDGAIIHIQQYGTNHTEAIVATDQEAIDSFCQQIDAACITVNASTRFTDGGEFGFGAEIGISTQKLHARGPMGLDALTSYQYIATGCGQVK